MSTKLDPIYNEFETQEIADQYDQWFRAKVSQSLKAADDPKTARYSSDEMARRIHAMFELETA